MIMHISPLPCGNAVRLVFTPPTGANLTRILRKTEDNFAGLDDPAAVVVYEGGDTTCIDTGCANGTEYFYRAYYFVGGQWQAELVAASATPAFGFADASVDVQSLVRERLWLGLTAYAQTIPNDTGRIPVLMASPLLEEIRLPAVTVHLESLAPEVRGVGEGFNPMFAESYLSRWQLEIVGWATNGDSRKALRAAIHALLMANFAVFDAAGMVEIQFHFADMDDFQTYECPVYTTRCSLSCLAPSAIADTSPSTAIAHTTVNPSFL